MHEAWRGSNQQPLSFLDESPQYQNAFAADSLEEASHFLAIQQQINYLRHLKIVDLYQANHPMLR